MIVGFLIGLFQILSGVRKVISVFFEPFTMKSGSEGNGRCPDVFLLRRENQSRIQDRFIDGPADLVIEVVSESSTKDDYLIKLEEYRQSGVPEYWIIDPIAQVSSFFQLNPNGAYRETALNENGKYASPTLDGLEIDPNWFMMEELPSVVDVAKEWGLI
jgi:Uma2 family endonuclease